MSDDKRRGWGVRQPELFGNHGAILSPCRQYRYTLWRTWDCTKGTCLFIGLNPSTADEREDDPTIRRCVSFAKSFGCGRLMMANLFALRATDPADMKRNADPVGRDNDDWLRRLVGDAEIVIAAWGTHGGHLARDIFVRKLLGEIHCLGVTKKGFPRHPLYLSKETPLQAYTTTGGSK